MEDSGGLLRKVWIGVEGSIGPVLLKTQIHTRIGDTLKESKKLMGVEFLVML